MELIVQKETYLLRNEERMKLQVVRKAVDSVPVWQSEGVIAYQTYKLVHIFPRGTENIL